MCNINKILEEMAKTAHESLDRGDTKACIDIVYLYNMIAIEFIIDKRLYLDFDEKALKFELQLLNEDLYYNRMFER